LNPIRGFEWNFGDGTNGSGMTVAHSYIALGTYRIILTVLTSEGNPSASETLSAHGQEIAHSTLDGVIITAFASFTVNTATRSLQGTASLTAVNASSMKTILSKSFSINLAFGSSNSIKFVLSAPIVPFSLAVSCAVAVGSAFMTSCVLSRTPDLNNDGSVDFSDVTTVLFYYGSVQGSPGYYPAADLDGDGIVDFSDVILALYYYGAPVL
jgi:PKD repeat protein